MGAGIKAAEQPAASNIVPLPAAADDIPVMLGIKETAARFGLPVHFIRSLVSGGCVKWVQAGSKKIYVNQGSVIAFLNGGEKGGQ